MLSNKTNHQTNPVRKSLGSQNGQIHRRRFTMLLAAGLTLLSLVSSRAATQYWNGQAPLVGRYDGSGSWFTNNTTGSTTNWWNGTTDNTGTWTGSTPDTAIIGSGSTTPGAYTITLDAPVSAATVIFTNPGVYTLTGNNLLTLTSSGALVTNATTTTLTATIATPYKASGLTTSVGTNCVLNLSGGTPSGGGNPAFYGVNQANSAINFVGGYYNVGGGTAGINGVTALVSNSVFTGPSRLDIGKSFPSTLAVVSNSVVAVNYGSGNNAGNNLNISRGGAGVLNVLPGGLVATYGVPSAPSGQLYLSHDSANQATLNVSGGIVNVGSGTNGIPGLANGALVPITLLGSGSVTYPSNSMAVVNISGGIVTASAIEFGLGSAYTGNPTNRLNLTGGALYLDVGSISQSKDTGTNFGINLSGGIIGATTSWSPACSVPMTLGTINGNVTFQTADANNDPMTMRISGVLKGPGGMYVTGPGNLILSGANTYSGDTVISNGTLTIVTSGSPTNGVVSLDGTAGGYPSESVQIANVGQHWVISGLTYGSGSSTADFNYGSFTPSTTVAPILVTGNLNFAVLPNVTIESTAIPKGVYPLIQYGSLSGSVPTSSSLPGYLTGYVTNLSASKTIALVVTDSTYNPALSWAAGNGLWNTTTPNWKQFSGTVDYADGEAVQFDDTASGTSPITVTLNQAVNPSAVVANNNALNYVIAGSGAMAGNNNMTLIKDGTGSLTLSNANTFAGGTTLNNGTLVLNYGGNGSGLDSAIGTGPLTINGGELDNTSGKALNLVTPITQYWNGNFAFAGTTNFDLGSGSVTLGSANLTLTVNTNALEVDGVISDPTGNSVLTKAGNGTLILSNYNTFGSANGGLTLSAGVLDINADGALGGGKFTIQSGAILDNTSGAGVAITENNNMAWSGSFTFLGTTNLNLGGNTMSMNTITVAVSNNDLEIDATISGANNSITKTGSGSLTFGGIGTDGGMAVTINQGSVRFNKQSGQVLSSQTVIINTNTSLIILNPANAQTGGGATANLNGGLFELNGGSEPFGMVNFNSGLLANSAPASSSVLTCSGAVNLAGKGCQFGVTNASTLTIAATITNTGSLILTGGGSLTLISNNTYTGSSFIAAGTLALSDPFGIGAGSISNTVLIDVTNGATLDVSGRGDDTFTLNPGQTLTGGGSINGNLVTTPGSVLIPGDIVGTLTVTNSITLAGSAIFDLNRTNLQTSGKLVSISGAITGGGTLTATNVGPALHAGDTFQLFPSGVPGFTINLATNDANGYTYTWNNNIDGSGSISVATVTAPVTINPLPGPVQFNISGNTLTLSWPTNLGWILQSQTNGLGNGLSNNWLDVPGSGGVTSTNETINPANPAVFYRLRRPQTN